MVRNYSWSLSAAEISKHFEWNNRKIMDWYTNMFVNGYFEEQNPYCVLNFCYVNLKQTMSRKRNSAHFSANVIAHILCAKQDTFLKFWLNHWDVGYIEQQQDGKSCGVHVVEVRKFLS